MLITQHDAGALLQQVRVDRTRTQHRHLVFKGLALLMEAVILMGKALDIAFQRHQAQITPLARYDVICEVKTQAESDDCHKIVFYYMMLLEKLPHIPSESHMIPESNGDNSKNAVESATYT